MNEVVETARINKFAIVLLSTLAAVVGFSPLALLLQRPLLLLYIAGGSALSILLTLSDQESVSTEKPGFVEFVLAGWGAVAPSALMSAIWMIAYGLLYGLLSLIFRLLNTPPDPAPITFYISSVFPGMGVVFWGSGLNAHNMTSQLYPKETGIKSAFYSYATQQQYHLLLWTTVIIAVFCAGVWLFLRYGGTDARFYITFPILLMIASSPVAMMKAAVSRRETVKINKVAIVILSTLGAILGFLPLALLSQRLLLLLYIAGVTAIFALIMSFNEESIATEKPGYAEFLLAGWGAVALPGLYGLLCMIVYGILYGILSLVFLLLSTPPDPGPIAFYISFVPAMIGAVLGNGSIVMIPQLYPKEVGIKSAFYEYVTHGRRRILTWAIIIVVVFGGGLWWFLRQGGTGIWFYITLQILIPIFSFPVAMMEVEIRRSKVQYAVTKVGALLGQLGYDVKEFPRAYNADYDLWLVNLDLCAQRDGQHILIQIRTNEEKLDVVDWMTVSDFVTAATVWIQYQEEMNQHQIRERALLMILIDDVQEGDTFVTGTEREKVGVLHLSREELGQLLVNSGVEEQPAAQQMIEAVSQAMTSRVPR